MHRLSARQYLLPFAVVGANIALVLWGGDGAIPPMLNIGGTGVLLAVLLWDVLGAPGADVIRTRINN